MQLGTTGTDVLCVELALVALGHQLDAVPDDVFDESSVAALMAFQSAEGLVADGVVGPTTGERLAIWLIAPPTSSEPVTTTTAPPATVAADDHERHDDDHRHHHDDSGRHAGEHDHRSTRDDGRTHAAGTGTHGGHRRGHGPTSSAVGCTITTTVLLGTTGDDTRCVELALSSLGLPNVTVDGSFSAIDRDNLMWFQGTNGLGTDGVAGAATAIRLGIWGGPPPTTTVTCPITVTVRLASTGPAAACVEQALFNRGFIQVTVDGSFGTVDRTP